MKLGAYTACLHDRPLPEALDALKSNRIDLSGGQHRRLHLFPLEIDGLARGPLGEQQGVHSRQIRPMLWLCASVVDR